MQEIYSCLCNINSLLCFTNKYLTLFIVAIHTVKRLHFSTYFAAIRGQQDIYESWLVKALEEWTDLPQKVLGLIPLRKVKICVSLSSFLLPGMWMRWLGLQLTSYDHEVILRRKLCAKKVENKMRIRLSFWWSWS